MKKIGRALSATVVAVALSGCAATPVGLAMAGASMLAGAVAGTGGGPGPRRLTIDPNKALSNQLADVQRGATASCKAILAKMEAYDSTAGAPASEEATNAAGEAPATSALPQTAATPDTQEKADGPTCQVRPVCLAGADTPIQLMVCTRSTADAGGATEAVLAGAPAAASVPAEPIDEVAPRTEEAIESRPGPATTPPPSNDSWRWSPPSKG